MIYVGFYLLSVLINVFLVRWINLRHGFPGTAESIGRCICGPMLWVVVLGYWTVCGFYWILDHFHNPLWKWFDPPKS